MVEIGGTKGSLQIFKLMLMEIKAEIHEIQPKYEFSKIQSNIEMNFFPTALNFWIYAKFSVPYSIEIFSD